MTPVIPSSISTSIDGRAARSQPGTHGQSPSERRTRLFVHSNEPRAPWSLEEFLDVVATLSAGDWLRLGRRLRTDTAASAAAWTMRHARQHMDVAVAARRLALTVWTVCDAIDTAAFLAFRTAPPSSRVDGRDSALARAALENAGVSLLVWPDLSNDARALQDLVFSCVLAIANISAC